MSSFDPRPETAPTFPTIRYASQKVSQKEHPAVAAIREIWQDFKTQKGMEE